MSNKRNYRFDVWGRKTLKAEPKQLSQHALKPRAIAAATSLAEKGYFGVVYDRDEELGHFAPKGYTVSHKRVYKKRGCGNSSGVDECR